MKLRLEVEPCETLEDACIEAQRFANATAMPVEFQFNSVLCIAVPGGCADTLHQRQHEASRAVPTVTSA